MKIKYEFVNLIFLKIIKIVGKCHRTVNFRSKCNVLYRNGFQVLRDGIESLNYNDPPLMRGQKLHDPRH